MNNIHLRKKKEITITELSYAKELEKCQQFPKLLQTTFNRFKHNLDILMKTL